MKVKKIYCIFILPSIMLVSYVSVIIGDALKMVIHLPVWEIHTDEYLENSFFLKVSEKCLHKYKTFRLNESVEYYFDSIAIVNYN